MNALEAATNLAPQAYAGWRATSLGDITEAIERRAVPDTMGGLAGTRPVARAGAAKAKLDATFVEGRLGQLPFPDTSFDVVASVTVLCFVAAAAGAVREMARVLRTGGRLVLGELRRWSIWASLRRLRGWLGSPTSKAARFRSSGELRALVEQVGLLVTTLRGRSTIRRRGRAPA